MAGSATSGRPGRKTADEERKLLSLLTKSYDFLNNYFEKFDERTKVQISLELIKRRVPQQVEHKGDVMVHLAERIKEGRNRVEVFNRAEN